MRKGRVVRRILAWGRGIVVSFFRLLRKSRIFRGIVTMRRCVVIFNWKLLAFFVLFLMLTSSQLAWLELLAVMAMLPVWLRRSRRGWLAD